VVTPAPFVVEPQLHATVRLMVRERLMQLVAERLAMVRVSNGYHSEAGLHVYYGLIDLEPPVLPCLMYEDPDERATKTDFDTHTYTLTVQVEFCDRLDAAQAAGLVDATEFQVRAVRAAGDIAIALWHDPATGQPDPTFGGLATALSYTGTRKLPGLRDVPWAGSLSEFALEYETVSGDPYRRAAAPEEEE
jgi:hypothetical protein